MLHWTDWTTGDHGDLIDLVRSVYDVGFEGAVTKIEEVLGESFRIPREETFSPKNGASVNGQVDVNKDGSAADPAKKSRLTGLGGCAPPKKSFEAAVEEFEQGPMPDLDAPPLEIIFDVSGSRYYGRAPKEDERKGEKYIFHGIEALRRHLVKTHGLDDTVRKGQAISEVNAHIEYAENHNRVDMVGEYAGYRESKIYEVDGGNRLLVPSIKGLAKITPEKGEIGALSEDFWKGLLPDRLS